MQRYFINQKIIDLNNNIITIEGSDVHHIKNVMRMKIGDQIICVTDGVSYLSQITQIGDVVISTILETIVDTNELNIQVDIAHGLTTREKREEVIQKLTQLGACSYYPIIMEKSLVKMNDNIEKQTERLRKIAKEASEQSQRTKIMDIHLPLAIDELIKIKDQYDTLFIASTKVSSEKNNLKSHIKPHKKVLVVIGPEAGISPKEEQKLIDNGFIPLSLGKRILRTEVAPVYIMSVISYLSEFGDNDEV